MRVGFFGGSFDPPHRGHLAAALAAADRFGLERVLLAPTARQPLKPDGPVASFEDRLEMVRLLCEGSARLEASAVDAPAADGQPNYTIDTLQRLQGVFGADETIFVIVGVDAFLGLRRWRARCPSDSFSPAPWPARLPSRLHPASSRPQPPLQPRPQALPLPARP